MNKDNKQAEKQFAIYGVISRLFTNASKRRQKRIVDEKFSNVWKMLNCDEKYRDSFNSVKETEYTLNGL